jgi:O-antigen/teichoic acid export membrane protein
MAAMTLFGLVKTLRLNWPEQWSDFAAGARRLAVSLRGDAGWNMAGIVAASGYAHAPLFVLGSMAPALNVAAFTAVRAPLQPLQIVIRSFDLVDKLVFGRIDRSDRGARARHLARTYVTYLVMASVMAGAISVAAEPIIRHLLGETYVPFAGTLRLWAAVFVLMTSSLPLETAMLAAGRHRSYALFQAAGGAVALAAAFPLCRALFDAGAVLACLVGWSVTYALVAIAVMGIVRDEKTDI